MLPLDVFEPRILPILASEYIGVILVTIRWSSYSFSCLYFSVAVIALNHALRDFRHKFFWGSIPPFPTNVEFFHLRIFMVEIQGRWVSLSASGTSKIILQIPVPRKPPLMTFLLSLIPIFSLAFSVTLCPEFNFLRIPSPIIHNLIVYPPLVLLVPFKTIGSMFIGNGRFLFGSHLRPHPTLVLPIVLPLLFTISARHSNRPYPSGLGGARPSVVQLSCSQLAAVLSLAKALSSIVWISKS